MHIEIIKTEAPKRLEAFVAKVMNMPFNEWRAKQSVQLQQVIDLLWRASSRLELFLGSSCKKGDKALSILKDAESSLMMALKRIGEICAEDIEYDEEDEERVCRECGGPNVTIARLLVCNVLYDIDWNKGGISAALAANMFASWYRVAREIKALEEKRK